MSFFKNLFNKGEPFIPTPTQEVPGIEPILVQAIENWFPNPDDQNYVFRYILAVKKIEGRPYRDPRLLLGLLAYSKGKIENLIDPNSDYIREPRFMGEEIYSIFPNMKAAEEWVKSITKTPM